MFFSDFLIAFYVVFGLMTLMWVIYLLEKNPAVADVGWSFSIGCASLALFVFTKTIGVRQIVVVILTLLWSVRITIFLITRMSHGNIDPRYLIVARNWKALKGWKFSLLFFLQAVVALVLMIPPLLIYNGITTGLTSLDYIAIAWFVVSFIAESAVEYELAQYRRAREHDGILYVGGIWRYARHPNYFFEINIWLSLAFFATLSHHYGYIAFIAPLIQAVLIIFVTGIPPEEEDLIDRYGDVYQEYIKKTSLIVPWFPKK